jgi:hypothetical protein
MLVNAKFLATCLVGFFLPNQSFAGVETTTEECAAKSSSVYVAPPYVSSKRETELLKTTDTISLCIAKPEVVKVDITLSRPTWWTAAIVDEMTSNFLGHFGLSSIDSRQIVAIRVKWSHLDALYLSPTAFSGLYDPSKMEITRIGDKLTLSYEGGDAASSYEGRLTIYPWGPSGRYTRSRSIKRYTESVVFKDALSRDEVIKVLGSTRQNK